MGRPLFRTDASIEVSRARAVMDNIPLGRRVAITLGVIRSTVELFAAGARVQNITLSSKGVAKCTSQSARQKPFNNSMVKHLYVLAELI